MNYKIVVDTNQVFNYKGHLNEPFNRDIPSLFKFLRDNDVDNVKICLPEIVIKERIQHKLEQIEESINLINKNIRDIRSLGHNPKEIRPKENYRKVLEHNVHNFVRRNRVKRMPFPDINKEKLIDRAIMKMSPFENGDVGFKDTLIFLSIVEDALSRNSADVYILCSADKGFDEKTKEEFSQVTGKILHIIPSITKAEETLDELLPLNLQLEERNERIKNFVLNNSGKLVASLNRTLSEGKDHLHGVSGIDLIGLATESSSYSGFSEELSVSTVPFGRSNSGNNKVIGYNYKDIKFTSFDEIGDSNYRVGLRLEVSIEYTESQEMYSAWSANRAVRLLGYDHVPNTTHDDVLLSAYKSVDFTVDCNLEHNTLVIKELNL